MSEIKTHKDPKVSIIILNWNGLADTIECLESLKKITYPNYEVIVVDNASSGDDVKVLGERYGDYIHIIQNDRNYGFARGNNVGIRYALDKGTDYVLLLNNDTVVAPDFLDEMVKVAESDERIGIVCPKMYLYSQPDKVHFDGAVKVSLWWGTLTDRLKPGDERPVIDTEFATGAAMLVRRRTLEQIGLLPEEYFFGIEDIDYSLRALRHNFKIVVARKATVWHKISRTATPKLDATGIGQHLHKGWQILRRKYLSTLAYLLSTPCVLARQAVVALAILLRGIWHRDFREISALWRDMQATLKGIAEGLVSPRSRN
jgi:GT2 family glycosyltransferase